MLMGGLLAGLVLLELVLQAGALYVRSTRGTVASSSWIPGRRRVVALGDSNTYGLYLGTRSNAYPAVLERLWNEAPSTMPIEVLNLGFPGTNSSRIVNALPEILATLHPDVVTLMVGGNDLWTVPEPTNVAPLQTRRWELQVLLWRISRVYRALYMLRRATTPTTVSVDFTLRSKNQVRGAAHIGDQEVPFGWDRAGATPADWAARLGDNIIAIAEAIRVAGARLVLFTYPADRMAYAEANTVLRAVASRAQIPLIDLGPRFTETCPPAGCDEFYGDWHPTAKGHEHAARLILPQLREILDGGGDGSKAPGSPSS
jgi:lysophospholipase L1-like esterase